jgi:3-methyladenine DNA glycosylase/8-oxoguanine DNA glycosylase
VASENHYCIGLKENQPKLLEQARQCAQSQAPLSSHYQVLDSTHGRLVERRVHVFAAPPELSQDWKSLAAFVLVERSGIREGQYFPRQSWFILSQQIPAQQAAQLIQGHRGAIENQLHWVKDVVQHEDASLIQAAQPATLMSLLRSWAISAFRKAGHAAITKAIRLFGHDLSSLISFL